MIAIAILAGALTWLVVGMSRNIKAENHAKLMTTATFLARGKMSEFEDELYEKGFGEFEKDIDGTFDDKGFARFAWKIIVDKVELPSSEQMQTVLTNAQQAQASLQGGNAPTSPLGTTTTDPSQQNGAGNPMTSSAGALASQFGIIKDVLEQGIRRVTCKVIWYEGRTPQDVTIVGYFTDPRKVDQAIQLSIPGTGGAAGGSGGSTGGGGGSGGSGH